MVIPKVCGYRKKGINRGGLAVYVIVRGVTLVLSDAKLGCLEVGDLPKLRERRRKLIPCSDLQHITF